MKQEESSEAKQNGENGHGDVFETFLLPTHLLGRASDPWAVSVTRILGWPNTKTSLLVARVRNRETRTVLV